MEMCQNCKSIEFLPAHWMRWRVCSNQHIAHCCTIDYFTMSLQRYKALILTIQCWTYHQIDAQVQMDHGIQCIIRESNDWQEQGEGGTHDTVCNISEHIFARWWNIYSHSDQTCTNPGVSLCDRSGIYSAIWPKIYLVHIILAEPICTQEYRQTSNWH